MSELAGKQKEELISMLYELKKEQMNLRFQKKSGELGQTSRVKYVRRQIARIKTQLNVMKRAA